MLHIWKGLHYASAGVDVIDVHDTGRDLLRLAALQPGLVLLQYPGLSPHHELVAVSDGGPRVEQTADHGLFPDLGTI